MTKLALPQMFGLMMGTWFLALSAGNYVAGAIASLTSTGHGEGGGVETIVVYDRVGWAAVGVGVLFMVVAPVFKRLMHLDTLGEADHDLAGQNGAAQPDAAGTHTDRERK